MSTLTMLSPKRERSKLPLPPRRRRRPILFHINLIVQLKQRPLVFSCVNPRGLGNIPLTRLQQLVKKRPLGAHDHLGLGLLQ